MRVEVLEIATGTAAFVALKATRFMFKGDITALSSNGGDVLIRLGASGDQIALPAKALKRCSEPTDLSKYQIKGNTFVLILDGVTESGW